MELIITFVLYITVIFVIALVANRRMKTHAHFILAQRQLGPWSTALGAGASDMGGFLMMAIPGAAFVSGMSQIWMPIGLLIGAYLNWRFVAKPLREDSLRYDNAQTIPTFFYNRFNADAPSIKIAAALVILCFFTLYISSGFVSIAILIQEAFPMHYVTALTIGTFIIALYSALGGFLAINWVDIFQGGLMLLAFILVTSIIMQKIGYFHGIYHYHQYDVNTPLNPFYHFKWLSCVSGLGWGLGYFGQPHILVRFMAAQHAKNIPSSRRICMTWMLLCLIGAYLIGITGAVFFKSHLANPETVLLELGRATLNPWGLALLLSAIASAIMSTVAAQLIAACSTVTEDIYTLFQKKQDVRSKQFAVLKTRSTYSFITYKRRFFNSFLPCDSFQCGWNQHRLAWDRIILIVISCIAFLLALHPNTSLLNLVGYAWAGFGASFGPVLLFSLFRKKYHAKTAAIGMITGAIVTIVWHNLGIYFGGIFHLYELIPGFFSSTLTMLFFEPKLVRKR